LVSSQTMSRRNTGRPREPNFARHSWRLGLTQTKAFFASDPPAKKYARDSKRQWEKAKQWWSRMAAATWCRLSSASTTLLSEEIPLAACRDRSRTGTCLLEREEENELLEGGDSEPSDSESQLTEPAEED